MSAPTKALLVEHSCATTELQVLPYWGICLAEYDSKWILRGPFSGLLRRQMRYPGNSLWLIPVCEDKWLQPRKHNSGEAVRRNGPGNRRPAEVGRQFFEEIGLVYTYCNEIYAFSSVTVRKRHPFLFLERRKKDSHWFFAHGEEEAMPFCFGRYGSLGQVRTGEWMTIPVQKESPDFILKLICCSDYSRLTITNALFVFSRRLKPCRKSEHRLRTLRNNILTLHPVCAFCGFCVR